ncbi:MAG TPA: type II secretion system F family protein [Nitrospiria bacterium]|nr:type II secretion system F family protein [Nitrospiria bacterium]
MATFVWQGRSKQGAIQKGEITAANKDEVINILRKQSIMVTTVNPKSSGISFGAKKVTTKDIVIFTRQFSTMIDAGLPLVQCLEILSTQADNPTLRKTLLTVRQDVEGGGTYAESLKKHPKVFDDLYCNMVAAGEAGGILDTILVRLAKHMEKSQKLKAQIKSAMVYPAIIVSIAVLVIGVLMVFVIPTFAKMFTDFGGTLPLPTVIVIAASDFMQKYIILIVGAAVGGFIGIKKFYATPKGRLLIDTLLLKVPVMGDLIRKAAVAGFTRTMGTLISSGVPILDALGIVAKTAGNKVVENALIVVRQSISEGKTIAEPLKKTNVFPPMVVQMIGVGEATGALDAMLEKIADFYDDEVDAAVTTLTSMMEPLLMVFLGISIGFIVIAMYLPIFKMASIVG